jgi:hypothetical protein
MYFCVGPQLQLSQVEEGSFARGKKKSAPYESIRRYHQNGWIDPDTSNIVWSSSSFSNPRIDEYLGIIISHGILTQSKFDT